MKIVSQSTLRYLAATCLLLIEAAKAIEAAPLTLNTTVSGNISQPGQQVSYTFSGTAGQRIFYDALEADFDQIGVRLLTPSGTIFGINANSDSDSAIVVLNETGTYTLILDGVGATTGNFIFRLDDLGTQPLLPFDTIVTKILDPGYTVDWYQFDALGDEHLYFDGVGTGGGATWSLLSPNGSSLGSSGVNGDFEVVLTQPGVYLLAIAGGSATPVQYSVQVLTASDPVKTLQFNTPVSGTIAGSGNQEIYNFNGVAGQRIYYDALEGDFDSIAVRLLNPNGALVFLNQNTDSDGGPYTLVDSGTYTLIIDGSGATTGDYSFRLLNLVGLPVLPLDTPINKQLSPGFSTDFYTFNGTAGQNLFFDGLGATANGNVVLFGSGNENLGATGIGGDLEITLPRTGAYLLAVSGGTANPLNYSLQAVTYEVTTTPLTLGTTVNGNISEPGERDLYTFPGLTGQRIYYDALDRDFEGISVRLISPTGATLWDINHSSDKDPYTLTQDGTYTLVLDGNGGTMGDYSFRVLDLAAAPPLTLGTPISAALNPRTRTDMYQFNGVQGQRINFDSITATGSDATWRLVSPANVTLVTGQINADLPRTVLPIAGPMVLLIEGTTENVAPLNYQIRLIDESEAPVGVTGLNAILTGSVTAASPTTNKFSAPAGLLVYFDSQDRTSGGVTVEFRDPANVLVGNPIGASTDFGPFLLPSSGSYSIVIRGTGNYRFRLLDLAASSDLNLGAEVQANLDPGYRTDIYKFEGLEGMRLFYDALDNDFDQVAVRLVAPENPFRINSNSDSDTTVPFTLSSAGTYYLIFESQIATVADYHFRLLDIDAAPSLPIGTQVKGNLTPGLGTTLYRLSGSKGRLLYFDSTGTINTGTWTIYGPNNEALQAVGLVGDMEQLLPADGVYVVALSGNAANPVPFEFQVYDPNAVGGGPVITSIKANAGTTDVEWTTIAGLKYVLQFKAALEDPTWTDLSPTITAAASTASKTDTVGAAATKRFYRVKQVP